MGRIYSMNEEQAVVVKRLRANEIPGLTFIENREPTSLWPEGVTDGKSFGWFEGCLLLFWGTNDETGILNALKSVGIQTRYIG